MCKTLGWFGIVWLLSKNVNLRAQCSTRDENFNSPDGGPFFTSEEVVPLEMLITMVKYLELLRTEWWYVTANNITVTRMGDDSCEFVGKGIGLEDLDSFDQNWTVPLLTNLEVVGNRVFIPGKLATFASINQFTELVEILQLKSQIEMGKNPRIVLNLSTRTLTNYDSTVTNSCLMVGLTVNIKHKMEVMLISVGEVWQQFLSVMNSFGQKRSIEVLKQCCGKENLTLQSLLYLPDPLFTVCTKQLLSRNHTRSPIRKGRSVSLLSQLFGDGEEILKVEGTLAEAISRFNQNFKKEERFDNQVQKSLMGLDSEMTNIISNEEKLRNKMLELHLDLQQYRDSRDYIMTKSYKLSELEVMLERSILADQIKLLERASFHQTDCKLRFCELEIHAELKEEAVGSTIKLSH